MIYMRERINQKKNKGKINIKGNILEGLKSKIQQGMKGVKNSSPEPLDPSKTGQNEINANKPTHNFYKIAKKEVQSENKMIKNNLVDHKLCQSIVIDEGQKELCNEWYSRSKRILTIQKNFDIQIQNKMGSRIAFENHIKFIQKENQILKGQVNRVKKNKQKEEQDKINKIKHLEEDLLKKTIQNTQNQETINKYQKYFQQSKDLLVNAAVQLVEAKISLGLHMSPERLIQKKQQLESCLVKIKNTISIYDHFLKYKSKQNLKQSITFDELNSIVKCQQKTIQMLSQSKNYDGYLHENMLLRYEINRLSENNQKLIKNLNQVKHQKSKDRSYNTSNKKQIKIFQEQLESFSQTQQFEKEGTPIVRLQYINQSVQTPIDKFQATDRSQEKKLIQKLNAELQKKNKKIQNLEIQKQYISDQLMSNQKDLQEMKISFREISVEKEKNQTQIYQLQESNTKISQQLQVLQEQYRALNENREILEQRIKLLQGKQNIHSSRSRYVQLPDDSENVTVQMLLKFLKRKQLNKYHRALMQLINTYQIKISELNMHYLQQKAIKDKHFSFCRDLITLINTKKSISLQKLVDEINKYSEKVDIIKQKQIDKLLRKIRGLAIGIDEIEMNNIQNQLEDYVNHLQKRLPVLSEDYFEDGSSVAESLNASIENFQI